LLISAQGIGFEMFFPILNKPLRQRVMANS